VETLKRASVGLVAVMVGLASPMAVISPPANAMPLPASVSDRAAAKPVLSSSAKDVTEGDRLTLTAKVKTPKMATRATLQKWSMQPYSSTASWTTVTTVKVRGRSKIPFKTVATDENTERYRVSVADRHVAQQVKSSAVRITIWRWIPLNEYRPYYEAEAYAAGFGSTSIAGRA
jgi:hypothetical protein